LYLINESSFFNPVETVLENVEYSDWIGEDNLVYANKFEIWTYNTSTGNKNLLTRISKPLIGVNWHPTGSYVLYYTETSLNVIETGKRRRRDVTKLMNVNKIYSPAISADGDVIYFNAEIGRSAGLYKLNL
jgi:tricorn protease-like protein